MAAIRCAIVDDEPLARRGVQQLLRRHADFQVVAQCSSGHEAVEKILTKRPDVVFMDVQMPELDGFEVIRLVYGEYKPLIVFLTAYDEYAVSALRVRAVDYLQKPIRRDEFDAALTRVRERLDSGMFQSEVAALVADTRREQAYVTRILVHLRKRAFVIEVNDIEAFRAAGNYVRVMSNGRSYLLRETMKNLEEKLDPERFVRIHRQSIINFSHIGTIESDKCGGYWVILRSGARMPVGRIYRHALMKLKL